MANSVLQDRHGPDWPLGFIKVVTPGTPVGIMSVVDPTNINSPSTVSSVTNPGQEYSVRANQIVFMAYKPTGASPAYAVNTGLSYVVRLNAGSGSNNRADSGVLVKVLQPGETFVLAPPSTVEDVFGPYRYAVDADNANDGVMVVLVI